MFTRVAPVTTAIPMAVKAVGISILLIIMPWISGKAEAQQQTLAPHGEGVGACQNCHIPQGWHKIVFNHSQTSFPLEGAHRSLRCQDCHNLQSFSNLSPECQTCHTNAHQGRFSQDCQRCHTSRNWLVLEMSVAHRGTIFIMGGPHEKLDCLSCHEQGFTRGFQMVNRQCQDCHLTDYQNTSNPPHAASRFPTQCDLCHQFIRWQPAYFREHEPYFPIYSGSHQGVWSSCTSCHNQGNNYAVFTCIDCHEHRQDKVDSEHREVAGYVYSSTACYQCHPRGNAEEGD